MNSKNHLMRLSSVTAIILVMVSIIIGVVIFNSPDIRTSSPRLFRTLLYISFILNTCAIVIEFWCLRLRKKIHKTIMNVNESVIFLLFTILTGFFWLAHILEFIGLLERQGYNMDSNILVKFYSAIMLIATLFIMPILVLLIIILVVSSAWKFIHGKLRSND